MNEVVYKEQQDWFWSELSEKQRRKYRDLYKKGLDKVKSEEGFAKGLYQGELNVLVDFFGEMNLNTEPEIKTWEDVEKYKEGNLWVQASSLDVSNNTYINYDYLRKAEASIKIAILIDLAYGGMITTEEWENDDIVKHCVVRDQSGLRHCCMIVDYEFVAFHTAEQYEEFVSHESNRKLLNQYFMM